MMLPAWMTIDNGTGPELPDAPVYVTVEATTPARPGYRVRYLDENGIERWSDWGSPPSVPAGSQFLYIELRGTGHD